MIPAALGALTKDHIDTLLRDSISEDRGLDYKRELPSENDRIGFLRDVSAFANTDGGDRGSATATRSGFSSTCYISNLPWWDRVHQPLFAMHDATDDGVIGTLLHELCHAATGLSGHGPEFAAEVGRLDAVGVLSAM